MFNIVVVSHIIISVVIFAGLPLILGSYNLSAQTEAMTTEMVIWGGNIRNYNLAFGFHIAVYVQRSW